MLAAQFCLENLFLALLKKKAYDVNAKDKNGDTALILAARHHDSAIIIRGLLEHGADASLENKIRYTAHMTAKKMNNKGICPLLKLSFLAPVTKVEESTNSQKLTK